MTYGEIKLLSTAYQISKDALRKAFNAGQYGNWVKKPLEQSDFGLTANELNGKDKCDQENNSIQDTTPLV